MTRTTQRELIHENRLQEAVEVVKTRLDPIPTTAVILGSGLAGFVDTLEKRISLSTGDIPHYPASTVEGHPGRWVVGRCEGLPLLVMQGRIHGYEGYRHDQIAFPIHIMAEVGVRTLVITNAAGAINRFYKPGDFMVIVDHINLTFDNPLFGPRPARMGPRFPDMIYAYDPEYVEIALEAGRETGLMVHKGVYLGVKGPSYETAAEIRMAERIGADAVGMSTVPEVIAATFRGMRVLGISYISNMATGISAAPLSHDEVTEMGRRIRDAFAGLLKRILRQLADHSQSPGK